MTENIKVGDRVKVKLTGSLFRESYISEGAGLAVGQVRTGVARGDGLVDLDGCFNPYFPETKKQVWGWVGSPEESGWSVEVVERDPTNDFKVGDKVKMNTSVYGHPGQVGEVVSVDPWSLVMVAFGDYTYGLSHYPHELEKIELPEEQPLAEWEMELLGVSDLDNEPEPEPEPFQVGDRVKIGLDNRGKEVYLSDWALSGSVGVIGNIYDEGEYRGRYGVDLPGQKFQVTFHAEELELVEGAREELEGIKVGDDVFIHLDDLYGRQGTVISITADDQFWILEPDGTPHFLNPESVTRLPTMEEMDESGTTDEILLGICREGLVSAGREMGHSRPQIKGYTEAALVKINNYLADIRAASYAEGFAVGKSWGLDDLHYLSNTILELIEKANE